MEGYTFPIRLGTSLRLRHHDGRGAVSSHQSGSPEGRPLSWDTTTFQSREHVHSVSVSAHVSTWSSLEDMQRKEDRT